MNLTNDMQMKKLYITTSLIKFMQNSKYEIMQQGHIYGMIIDSYGNNLSMSEKPDYVSERDWSFIINEHNSVNNGKG